MTKPRTFRKKNDRSIRLAKAATAREAIGTIEPGTDTFVLTFGQFSLIDALVHVLDQTGPARVDISTWTAADALLQRSADLLESAAITRFRMIVDRSFETRQPGYCHHMRELFGCDCIRAIRTHAKFAVIRGEELDVVIRTSMNLNENPRLENIELSADAAFADFFEQLVDQVFEEVPPGENRSAALELEQLQDSFPFQPVEADHIPRESLQEPTATHTLKRH